MAAVLAPGTYAAKSPGFGVPASELFACSRPSDEPSREIASGTELEIVAVHDGFYQTSDGDWIAGQGLVGGAGGFGPPKVLGIGNHVVAEGFMGLKTQKAWPTHTPNEQPVRAVAAGEEFEIVGAAEGADCNGVMWLQTDQGLWVDQAALQTGAPTPTFGGGEAHSGPPPVWPAGLSLPVDDRNITFS